VNAVDKRLTFISMVQLSILRQLRIALSPHFLDQSPLGVISMKVFLLLSVLAVATAQFTSDDALNSAKKLTLAQVSVCSKLERFYTEERELQSGCLL